MHKSEKWPKRGNSPPNTPGHWHVGEAGSYRSTKTADYNEYFKVLWKNDVLTIIVITSVLANVHLSLHLTPMITPEWWLACKFSRKLFEREPFPFQKETDPYPEGPTSAQYNNFVLVILCCYLLFIGICTIWHAQS